MFQLYWKTIDEKFCDYTPFRMPTRGKHFTVLYFILPSSVADFQGKEHRSMYIGSLRPLHNLPASDLMAVL